jgi:O-antigen/teichoic acid export membrane protein
MYAATVLTSGIGFIYWAAAARLFSTRAVGYGSSAVSAMMFLGTIGMLGLGTVLIAELARDRDGAPGLVTACLLASTGVSVALGLAYAVLAPLLDGAVSPMFDSPLRTLVFAAGVGFTAVTAVLDEALVGRLQGGLQLQRNAVFAVLKVALVLLGAGAFARGDSLGIVASWGLSAALSLGWVAIVLSRRGLALRALRPDWKVLRSLGRTAVIHHMINLAVLIPPLVLPILVTILVSPEANAVYYASWMIVSFLFLVPVHLSTVLFAVAAADAEVLRKKLRFTLVISSVVGLVGCVALFAGAPLLMRMFGPGYVKTGTAIIRILTFGYFPFVLKVHYIAVSRVRGNLSKAALWLTAGSVLELVVSSLCGVTYGVTGVAAGLFATLTVEGAIAAFPVLRTAFYDGGRVLPAT